MYKKNCINVYPLCYETPKLGLVQLVALKSHIISITKPIPD